MKCVKCSTTFVTMILLLAGIVQADESSKKAHPLQPAIQYAESCLKKVEAIPSYEAVFFKQEIVGTSLVKQKIKIKIRHRPFSVYLHFENPHEGREVLYVEGQNNGNLLAHEAGLLSVVGTMELVPTDSTAMSENRYPITMAGIGNLVDAVIKQWREEVKFGESDVKYYKDAQLGKMTCRVIECSHPTPRRQFRFQKTRLWVDDATGLPVRVQQYGFPKVAGGKPPLVEDYTFSDIRTNVRLTDADFDRGNTKYAF
jgi:outer membrane lipoprotein-sorting protein